MVFSSVVFVFLFLPLALALYHAARLWGPRRSEHYLLTLLSYVFYGWTNPLFVVLMFSSTLIDYCAGLVQTGHLRRETWRGPVPLLDPNGPRQRHQRWALIVSICSNLTLLGFFKYFNFGLDSWNALMEGLGLEAATYRTFLRITLPLGISFYTFQSMSYSIDVYRGQARAIRHVGDFFCYISMFPQLVAGPIVRFQEVADQLRERSHTLEKFARGAAFFSMGMAKKILLADPCGAVADTCFAADSLRAIEAWYGVVAYAFQIYFDFSAYSDMAIGLGLMMGFMFAKNFDSPYHAASITEFWRRWHLSLSTWLRDYLYVPLGGNRQGPSRTYVNLMLVMLLGGLWHGAAWTFVIWGAIHGGMLALERLQGRDSPYRRLPHPLRVAITFIIVLVTWVFFRAEDLATALRYCGDMIGLGGGANAALVAGRIYSPYHLLSLLLAGIIAWGGVQTWDFTRRLNAPRLALIMALLVLSLTMLAATSFHPFIYFIF